LSQSDGGHAVRKTRTGHTTMIVEGAIMWKALVVIIPASVLLIFDNLWNCGLIAWADAHEGLAAWVQAVGVFGAVFLAGDLARLHASLDAKKEAASKRKAAAMLLLLGVRRWHRALLLVGADIRLALQTEGNYGGLHKIIPVPSDSLERALDRGPDLATEDVQALLDAIDFRDKAQAGVDEVWDIGLGGREQVAKVVLEEGEKLSSSLEPIIRKLEREAGFNWAL